MKLNEAKEILNSRGYKLVEGSGAMGFYLYHIQQVQENESKKTMSFFFSISP